MRIIGNTIERKLLLLLLLVGVIPAAVAVLHVHWGTLVGIDDMLGRFLQERAEQTARAFDRSFARYFEATSDLRQEAELNRMADPATSSVLALFDDVAVVKPDGTPEARWGSGPAPRYLIPVSLQRPGLNSFVFLHEVAEPDRGASRLLFITPFSDQEGRLLVASISSARFITESLGINPAAPHLGSVYSNRGLFVSGPAINRRALETVHERLASSSVAGWIGPRTELGRELVGYASPKQLRSRRNEGLTSVDWLVLARMDVGDATALFSYLLWRSLLFGLFLAPVLVVLSYWLARRFVRPVHELHRQIDRVGAGDLTARSNISTGDELEDLGTAFNEMARNLDFSQAALEEQMRTAETKARQISFVHNIAGAIIAAFDLPRLFRTTHEQLSALLPHDAMTAVVFDRNGPGADLHDFSGGIFSGSDAGAVRRFCEQQFTETEAAHILDAGTGGGVLPPSGNRPSDSPMDQEYHQFCLLPLRAEHGLLGALVLARRTERRFADSELRTLVQITQVLALAVDHIALYERTRNFASDLEQKVAERAEQLERAQDKLIQAERFAATGRLAASIAHEINNPLGIIKNYLRILRDRLPSLEGAPAEALTVVNEELDRIARIVKGLLYFYRPSNMREVELNLNEEIRVLLPLMEAGFRRKRIALELDLQEDLPRPMLSQDQIRQVLLNLIKNAEDAIADGGIIRISTASEGTDPDDGNVHLVLRLSDSGCGISPEDLPHIFEPFYTSKRDGQGTGLGLSVTYGIIRNLQGTIDVDSTPGSGTTVTVRIPVRSNAIALPAR